jgi:hypothetical protein
MGMAVVRLINSLVIGITQRSTMIVEAGGPIPWPARRAPADQHQAQDIKFAAQQASWPFRPAFSPCSHTQPKHSIKTSWEQSV